MSLNNYRNSHYRVLHKAKKVYTEEIMREAIQDLPGFLEIELEFTVYPPTKRKYDLDNYGSVTCKFFQDALVRYRRIPGDDYQYIKRVTYSHGEVDKYNPRIEITIRRIK